MALALAEPRGAFGLRKNVQPRSVWLACLLRSTFLLTGLGTAWLRDGTGFGTLLFVSLAPLAALGVTIMLWRARL